MFIHGVRFSKKPVWMSSGPTPELWPRWLADDIPGLTVWSVEHDSAPTKWFGHAMPLVDRANNILPRLLAEPRLAQGDIAFVTHSFGGLILQQVLREANDRSSSDPVIAEFVRRVSRVAFLGTPHRGVDLATWVGWLRLLSRPSAATEGLARNDPSLRGLNQWFRRFVAQNQIGTLTLVESRKTWGILVVPPDSSDPGLPTDAIPLDADHFGIAAPTSRLSQAYVHIRDFLAPIRTPRPANASLPIEILDGVARGTKENTETLRRIENTLNVAVAASTPPVLVPQGLVDAETDRRLCHLRRSRFLVEADSQGQASRLAEALGEGELRLASNSVKARALGWSARVLMDRPDREQAKGLVRAAGQLERVEEVLIAEAFEQFHDGDLTAALGTLSKAKSSMSRSAAFIIVRKGKGPEEALSWLRQSGLTPKDLDSDGKFFVMSAQLDARRLDESLETS